MKNIRKNVVITAIIIIVLFSQYVVIKCEKPELIEVLILYDSLAKDTEYEGNIALVVELVNSFGKRCSTRIIDEYEKGLVQKYDYIIIIRNSNRTLVKGDAIANDVRVYNTPLLYIGKEIKTMFPKLSLEVIKTNNVEIQTGILGMEEQQFLAREIEFIKDKKDGHMGVITNQFKDQYPFGVIVENIFYVPYVTKDNIGEIALAKVLQAYFNIKRDGNIYLFIKEVYPFSDLKMLCKMSEAFYENGISFICGVVPIFQNMDYAAIRRYAQVLRYVQSNGGSIIIQEPNVRENEVEKETLQINMAKFIDYLVAYDVVPLGVGVHSSKLYNNYYRENLFNFFSTNVLLVGKDSESTYIGDYYTFKKGIYGIDYSLFNRFNSNNKMDFLKMPIDIAIEMNISRDEFEINEVVNIINNKWIPIKNYRQINQTVETKNNKIKSNEGAVLVNNIEKSFEYKEKPLVRISEKGSSQIISLERVFIIGDKILVMVVMISLIIFSVLILIGIQLYRNKFMK